MNNDTFIQVRFIIIYQFTGIPVFYLYSYYSRLPVPVKLLPVPAGTVRVTSGGQLTEFFS